MFEPIAAPRLHHTIAMVHEQRIGPVLHQETHDAGLTETRGQPERRRSHQFGSEVEVM